MSNIGKIIILAIAIFLAIVLYSHCMAAYTSDEIAEKAYQDYLEYKRRKERERDDAHAGSGNHHTARIYSAEIKEGEDK